MSLEKSVNKYSSIDSAIRELVGEESCKGVLYDKIKHYFNIDYGNIRVIGVKFDVDSDDGIKQLCINDPEYFVFQYGQVAVSLNSLDKNRVFVGEYINPIVINSYTSISNISSYRNLLMQKNNNQIFICIKKEEVHELLEGEGISNIISSKNYYMYLENSMEIDVILKALFEINFNNPIEKKLAYSKCWSLLSLTLQNLNLKVFKKNISLKTVTIGVNIQTLILKNISAKISVEDIADYLGVDSTLARRSFESVFHETIHQYYSRKRLELAARMVLTEELPITDIASKLGYAHLGHFSNKFKAKFGALPKDFSKNFERCESIVFSNNCVDRYCSQFSGTDWMYDNGNCRES